MPEKPENAIAARLAATSRIGKPRNAFGGSENSILARTPAKITIAIVNPSADENPNTTLSRNEF